jgi:hypothetical protein
VRTSGEALPAFQATTIDTDGTGSYASGLRITPGGSSALTESGSSVNPRPSCDELQVAEHVVGARDRLHPDTRLAVQRGDHIVQRGRKRSIHRDARQIVQEMRGDAFASGQCMVRRQDDHDLLAYEIDNLESFDVQRPAHERDVKSPRPQPGHGLDGVLSVQDEAQVRQVRGDERAQWRKDSDVGGRKGSH